MKKGFFGKGCTRSSICVEARVPHPGMPLEIDPIFNPKKMCNKMQFKGCSQNGDSIQFAKTQTFVKDSLWFFLGFFFFWLWPLLKNPDPGREIVPKWRKGFANRGIMIYFLCVNNWVPISGGAYPFTWIYFLLFRGKDVWWGWERARQSFEKGLWRHFHTALHRHTGLCFFGCKQAGMVLMGYVKRCTWQDLCLKCW